MLRFLRTCSLGACSLLFLSCSPPATEGEEPEVGDEESPPNDAFRPATPRDQLPWKGERIERLPLAWGELAWSDERSDYGHDLAVADFNGDGRDDVFVAGWGARDRLYLGTEDGTLKEGWADTEDRDTHGLAVGDFNGDGTPDVATANRGGTSRIWLGPALKESVELPGTWLAKSVVLGDVDKDGDCDVVLGLEGPNQLFLNDKGSLHAAWVAAEDDASDAVDLSDVDGDGDLDLVVGNSTTSGQPNRVYLFEGRGFRLVWSSPDKRSTNGVRWVDLDGDGQPEIAAANADGADQIFGKKGSGYQLLWETPEVEESLGVAVGDLDDDGRPDLVFLTSSNVQIHLNRSKSFVGATTRSPVENPQAISLMDLDGDGRGDPTVAGLGKAWIAVVRTEVLPAP